MSDLDIRIPEASRAKAERIYACLMAGFCVVLMLTNYIFKLVLAVLDTPLIYLGVGWLRRKLAIVERT